MGEWLVAVEWNVLVGVRGFAVDVKVEGAVGVVDDGDIKHGYATIFFDFLSPLDVRVNGVEVIVEWLNVVVVNGDKCVVGFSKPKKDEIAGTGGIVASRVIGEDSSFKIFHVDIR